MSKKKKIWDIFKFFFFLSPFHCRNSSPLVPSNPLSPAPTVCDHIICQKKEEICMVQVVAMYKAISKWGKMCVKLTACPQRCE